jgi:hypothetical protein
VHFTPWRFLNHERIGGAFVENGLVHIHPVISPMQQWEFPIESIESIESEEEVGAEPPSLDGAPPGNEAITNNYSSFIDAFIRKNTLGIQATIREDEVERVEMDLPTDAEVFRMRPGGWTITYRHHHFEGEEGMQGSSLAGKHCVNTVSDHYALRIARPTSNQY